MKNCFPDHPVRATCLIAAFSLLLASALVAQSGVVVERTSGRGHIRSDDRARHGDFNNFSGCGAPGECLYLESYHVSGDSGGAAFGGESAGLWSAADTGFILNIYEEDNALVVARIDADGGYAEVSDLRMKRDVRPVSSEDFLNRLLTLEAKRYKFVYNEENMAKGGAYLERDHLGLIAQDIEAVFPEAVTEDEVTGLKYVEYHQLIAVLIESIRVLSARIEVLEGRSGQVLAPSPDL